LPPKRVTLEDFINGTVESKREKTRESTRREKKPSQPEAERKVEVAEKPSPPPLDRYVQREPRERRRREPQRKADIEAIIRERLRSAKTLTRQQSVKPVEEPARRPPRPARRRGTLRVRFRVDGDPGVRGSWILGDIDNYVEAITGYLLDVRYDGGLASAVAFILGEDGRIYRWKDRTKHRPYFLTDAPANELAEMEVRRKVRFGDLPELVRFDRVVKFHPIRRENLRVTRVVVADPLAVRSLRRVVKERYRVWEADIRYHHNYIYDHQLTPGMVHSVGRGWSVVRGLGEDRVREIVEQYFADEDEEFKVMAREWIPVFEQEPPSPDRVSIDIEVYSPEEVELPDPGTAPYPVISIALADSRGMRKVLVLAREGVEPGDLSRIDGEVELFEDETSMILEALRIISQYPIIVSFNGDNFDLPYLYNRLLVLGYERDAIPIEFRGDYVTLTFMLHVDLHKLFDIRALQVYAFGNAYREKSLEAVSSALLKESKIELEQHVSKLSLEELAAYNLRDAWLTMTLTTYAKDLIWNLIVLLMRISKMGLEDVTRTQVSGWIRNLMNWEHRRRNYLIPSREEIQEYGGQARSQAIIKDKKYKGAIVIQPPQGVFFNVLVLDFASLYPSIIKNWNLSYETVNNPYCKGETIEIPEVGHKVCMSIRGISSQVVGLLKEFRVRIYKKKAKDKSLPERERLWYNMVQSAMKVYINASYGVFGADTFHLFSYSVAESVTAVGRSVFRATKQKAEELDLMILYGDTDSIFVWDPPEDRLGEIIRYVDEEFGLELERDKEFRLVLFSGLKKNYIGVTPEGDVVIKGMVGKKSNTPEFIKKEFAEAVRILASLDDPEKTFEILDRLSRHVASISRKLKNREYTLDELAIRVMLSKDLRDYNKNTPQHVKAALLLAKRGMRIGRGTIISYVKTRDRLGVKPVRLARLDEVDANKYQDYVKTVFEQMLMAFGVTWGSAPARRRFF